MPTPFPHTVAKAFISGASGFIGSALARDLRRAGVEVVGLARSERAADRVHQLGATVAKGDLSDEAALEAGMRGCDTVFHTAASAQDADLKQAVADNVEGSLRVVRAARKADVRRIVYLSGIGVLFGSGRIHNVDETHPRGRESGALISSRIASEEAMIAANSQSLPIMVLRLPYVWGPGNTLLPALKSSIAAGRFRWIGGGRHQISTLHVDNAVRGMVDAAERGRGGEVYWLSDGPSVELKTFLEVQLKRAGLTPPQGELSFGLAMAIAKATTFIAKLRGRAAGGLTPTTVQFMGQEITVNDAKARRELGYSPKVQWPTGSM